MVILSAPVSYSVITTVYTELLSCIILCKQMGFGKKLEVELAVMD